MFAGGNVQVMMEDDNQILLELEDILARPIGMTEEENGEFGRSKDAIGKNKQDIKKRENAVMVENAVDSTEGISFEDWLEHVRPEQDLAILSASGTFSGCESIQQFWDALLQV
jgi:hypothetical protein